MAAGRLSPMCIVQHPYSYLGTCSPAQHLLAAVALGCYRMRQEGEVADLLSVGRRGFLAVLLLYLQDHPGLLWQAQVAARQFPQASNTLLVAAEVDNVRGGSQGLSR